MNKKLKLINLILIVTLNFSCVEKISTAEETNSQELVKAAKADTLKFTSAIRAIFQDSKGNYWFGSHNEGVSFYNGKSFLYFTKFQGLADNQIRSIQEDKNGKIWIVTAKGSSVLENGSLKNYLTNANEPKTEWNKTNGDLWFGKLPGQSSVDRFSV